MQEIRTRNPVYAQRRLGILRRSRKGRACIAHGEGNDEEKDGSRSHNATELLVPGHVLPIPILVACAVWHHAVTDNPSPVFSIAKSRDARLLDAYYRQEYNLASGLLTTVFSSCQRATWRAGSVGQW